jgi:hypothetical protein
LPPTDAVFALPLSAGAEFDAALGLGFTLIGGKLTAVLLSPFKFECSITKKYDPLIGAEVKRSRSRARQYSGIDRRGWVRLTD